VAGGIRCGVFSQRGFRRSSGRSLSATAAEAEPGNSTHQPQPNSYHAQPTVVAPLNSGAPTGSLALIDPGSDAVTARTPVPGHPSSVASAPGGVWMADFREGVLWRYEPETGALHAVGSPSAPPWTDLSR
jgi:hypothetical protein